MSKIKKTYCVYEIEVDKIDKSKPLPFFKEHEFEATSYDEVLKRLNEISEALNRLSTHCTVDIFVAKALIEAKNDLSKIEVFLRNKEA